MNTTNVRLIACGFLLAVTAVSAGVSSTGRLDAVLSETFLVRAVVVEQLPDERGYSFTRQQIEHVYCGRIAVGDSFVDGSTPAAGPSAGMAGAVSPPLKVGESGLWLLRRMGDGQTIRRKGIAQLGLNWPVRQGIEKGFENASLLAKAIEQVWLANGDDERIALLTQAVESDVSEVSVAAILMLGDGAPDALRKLATANVIVRMKVNAQLALDEAMVRIDRSNWSKSDERQAMFTSWSAQADKAENMLSIVGYLSRAVHQGEIGPQQFVDLVTPFIANDAMTLPARQAAATSLMYVVNAPEVHDRVVSLLIDLLERGQSDMVPAVLTAFDRVEHLDGGQLARVVVLRDAAVVQAAQVSDKHDPIHRQAQMLNDVVKRAGSTSSTKRESGN